MTFRNLFIKIIDIIFMVKNLHHIIELPYIITLDFWLIKPKFLQ